MRAPLRFVPLAAIVAPLACAVLLGGCGAKFPLPTESKNRLIPSDGSYQLISPWDGLPNIRDIELAPGPQLFLMFNRGGTDTSSRGNVLEYQLVQPIQMPTPPFIGMFNPISMAGTGTRLFVLDQGDTALARRNPTTGRPSPDTTGNWKNAISDLPHFWKVLEYLPTGGQPIGQFTDTSMAYVTGIAADVHNNIYVGGVAIITLFDQNDSRITYKVYKYRIYKYVRGPRPDAPDVNVIPNTQWHRDTLFVAEDGSGIGSVNDSRGLQWGAAFGSGIYAADHGKNWVQKMGDTGIDPGLFFIDGTASGALLNEPVDVAADASGFIYLVEAAGGKRVLRYYQNDENGEIFVQLVNKEGGPLVAPIALTADQQNVYVADRGAGRVLYYQRRP